MYSLLLQFVLLLCISPLLSQTPWNKETVQGFPVYNNQLEITEGFGAYMDYCLRPNSKNFDNGGGSHQHNSDFLKKYYGVTNIVYDPYQRTCESNLKALAEVAKHDFTSSTSNSVLNVIDTVEDRLAHISLSCEALKDGGIAYFKIFPGNGSQIATRENDGYQSNCYASSYQTEVEKVFGIGNVVVDHSKHMIIAYKNRGCKSSE